MWGGAIFEPKTLSMYLKKKEQKNVKTKNVTEPGLEPTTSGLEKPTLLSTRLNTIIGITKYEGEFTIFKQQLFILRYFFEIFTR